MMLKTTGHYIRGASHPRSRYNMPYLSSCPGISYLVIIDAM